MGPLTDRRNLEDKWRERTITAAERYRNAKDIVAMLRLASGSMPPPDGSHAYRQALRFECDALERYRRTLELFNGLILHSRIPADGGE